MNQIDEEDMQLDAVRGVIGVWEGIVQSLIRAERDNAGADPARLEELQRALYAAARERHALRAADHASVAIARSKYAELIAAHRRAQGAGA
ncbi:hypothetical protein EJP67_33160 [Variovorax guangxiensis]|uniref:Uncharacterized protein n=1 Tax=Variovorax guangxiensis TaxID=1775474 RepID=A0A433MVQ2_9BURK|nr:hypothetical protein [Variovorax guangxiensis]RUR71908.1 hypothetical protein EJP67_33160 [Variovorax guangxiensis]